MANLPRYRILEELWVTEDIAVAHQRYRRFHDLYEALLWVLARDPLIEGVEEIAPETFMIKTAAHNAPGFCVITLVYTLTGNDLTIDAIKVEGL